MILRVQKQIFTDVHLTETQSCTTMDDAAAESRNMSRQTGRNLLISWSVLLEAGCVSGKNIIVFLV